MQLKKEEKQTYLIISLALDYIAQFRACIAKGTVSSKFTRRINTKRKSNGTEKPRRSAPANCESMRNDCEIAGVRRLFHAALYIYTCSPTVYKYM
jgi:hypothetical protein